MMAHVRRRRIRDTVAWAFICCVLFCVPHEAFRPSNSNCNNRVAALPTDWIRYLQSHTHRACTRRTFTSHDTPLRSATVPAEDAVGQIASPAQAKSVSVDPGRPAHVCKYCGSSFGSRNAMFRHIRSDFKCSALSSMGDLNYVKHSLAFEFGYVPTNATVTSSAVSIAQQATASIQSLLVATLQNFTQSHFNATVEDCQREIKFVSSTQSSVARLRHRVLSQDQTYSASADVLVVSVTAPDAMNTALWRAVFDRMTEQLQAQSSLSSSQSRLNIFGGIINSTAAIAISINNFKVLKDHINVEQACTQRKYHYLMPLRWLPNGTQIEDWWNNDEELILPGQKFKKATASPESLRKFRDALRLAAGSRDDNATIASCADGLVTAEPEENGNGGHPPDMAATTAADSRRLSARRFGALSFRERRPWHNFADPTLCGEISPSTDPVWKAVDRARIVEFISLNDTGTVVAVLEINGEDFLPQQVERIVGTAIAMAHGWLSTDFWDKATSPNLVVSTPMAPAGFTYMAGCRFHFEEMRNKGRHLFDSNVTGDVMSNSIDAQRWTRRRLLQRTELRMLQSDHWIDDVRDTIIPIIRDQLRALDGVSMPNVRLAAKKSPAPLEYEQVLSRLRNIVQTGSWPDTSLARSTIIRDSPSAADEPVEVSPEISAEFSATRGSSSNGDAHRNGSFTVVNIKDFPHLTYIPTANSIFPDLAQLIFQLECSLSNQRRHRLTMAGSSQDEDPRPPSSHCAVNCNAQFTPHVDSGVGAGQSLSMIVGLGDYDDGELFVEGTKHDIRYKPLEFDGWKLRHWTDRFDGERFSLVWFMPKDR